MRVSNLFRTTDSVVVDEEWYLSRYPDVRAAVEDGRLSSAASHYHRYGRRERRLPTKPVVDETWYLLRYPDVARAIRSGLVKDAYDHFVQIGYGEGRLPQHPSVTKRSA
jgi:hypothetical protein